MDIKKRVGIFGGTFNPIHLGHLILANAAREEYELEKIIFVPSSHPPHKNTDLASNAARYKMVEMAISDNPYFDISDVEMKRQGPSYTVDTLRYFHEKDPEVEWFFIIGMDTLIELPTWKYVDELIHLCHFLAALRPNYQEDPAEIINYFGDLGKEKIHYLHTLQLEISSTDLRNRLQCGRSVRYLIPDEVIEWICHHSIYGDKNG